MRLYNFDEAHKLLDKIGIPRLIKYLPLYDTGSKKIKEIPTQRLIFEDSGKIGKVIFIDENNIKRPGYVYDKIYRVKHFNKFPVFHIYNCEKILDFKTSGKFHKYYYWSDLPEVTIIDRDDGTIYKNQRLKLCSYCRKILEIKNHSNVSNTKEYKKILLKEFLEGNNKKIENGELEDCIDIYGYPCNWEEISLAYRKITDYTCENCGFHADEKNKQYIEVHHIDGNKLNTHTYNLKSLCTICHAYSDHHHLENYKTKPSLRNKIKNFVRRNWDSLVKVNNPYLNKVTEDFEVEF